jgi:SAM-dependent methyltransferase
MAMSPQPQACSTAADTGYPVTVRRRVVRSDRIKPEHGVQVFETPEAEALCAARLAHLDDLGLPGSGRSVLDLGCGIGHLARGLADRGCRVTCVDGRRQNVERLAALHPDLDAHCLDLDEQPLDGLGRFDAVLCYGLLYHLENPVGALRRMERACGQMLLLETHVCDCEKPVVLMADECAAANQAMRGIGSRPSPAWITAVLNRIGFAHVYGVAEPPTHPDFQFEWRNDMQDQRHGHLLRCVFVAARNRIESPKLTPLLTD